MPKYNRVPAVIPRQLKHISWFRGMLYAFLPDAQQLKFFDYLNHQTYWQDQSGFHFNLYFLFFYTYWSTHHSQGLQGCCLEWSSCPFGTWGSIRAILTLIMFNLGSFLFHVKVNLYLCLKIRFKVCFSIAFCCSDCSLKSAMCVNDKQKYQY